MSIVKTHSVSAVGGNRHHHPHHHQHHSHNSHTTAHESSSSQTLVFQRTSRILAVLSLALLVQLFVVGTLHSHAVVDRNNHHHGGRHGGGGHGGIGMGEGPSSYGTKRSLTVTLEDRAGGVTPPHLLSATTTTTMTMGTSPGTTEQRDVSPPEAVARIVTTTTTTTTNGTYRYNVCNGLSNQLLQHGAAIALAYQQNMAVEIPDHFIINGVQPTSEDVPPNANNSVPFGDVFDQGYFVDRLRRLGVDARMVTFDLEDVNATRVDCAGLGGLDQADPELVLTIIKAFRPSPTTLQPIISEITRAYRARGANKGICLHHRDGQDWHDHCARWGSIDDGIYRGNCLVESSLVDSLHSRGMTNDKWLYYCGDHEVPQELIEGGMSVMSRNDVLNSAQKEQVMAIKPNQPVRDVWALIDFFACGNLETFIGNSVSTFSAIQIALREGEHAYWSNSQSIPLADFWRVYKIPVVYTFTELSMKSGQQLLQTSILSVLEKMPNNKIHILYNGDQDTEFRSWLTDRGVIIHEHSPRWTDQIEEMRKNGDRASSHLFKHSGNYLGTWQRIDMPLLMDSEYCLLMDADTVITRPFTLSDFGLDMTRGLAMSSEMNRDGLPSNAGVTLMNIPFLRRTYNKFLEFILQHVETAKFDHPSPSDQGAYLDFYRNDIRYLSEHFNFKPYWPDDPNNKPEAPFITHFHGPKPHDYLTALMGKQCDQAFDFLCRDVPKFNHLCPSLQHFASASKPLGQLSYCNASFEIEAEVLYCKSILEGLADGNDEDCLQQQGHMKQDGSPVPQDNSSSAMPAVLIQAPKTINELWEEWETGIDGRKPAKLFTNQERSKIYYRRKVVWDILDTRVKAGDTPEEACNKIYNVYGRDTPVKDIIRMMKRDNNNGKLNADLTPAADLSPTPATLYQLWEEYQNGLDGRKAARLFTATERKRMYYRRKVVWDIVAARIRKGDTALVACDRIYKVYGRDESVKDIIKKLKQAQRDGTLPPEFMV